MSKLLSFLAALFIAECSLHAQDTVPPVRWPARHFIGCGISRTATPQDGLSYWGYSYGLLTESPVGYSVDYAYMNRIVGAHAQLRFTNYSYKYSTYPDPRYSSSVVGNSTTSTCSVNMVSFAPGITFSTRGEWIRGMAEIGTDVSMNVQSHCVINTTQRHMTIDSAGNPNVVTTYRSTETSGKYEELHVQGLLRLGAVCRITDSFYLSLFVRPRFRASYSFIPVNDATTFTFNFGLYYGFRSRVQ